MATETVDQRLGGGTDEASGAGGGASAAAAGPVGPTADHPTPGPAAAVRVAPPGAAGPPAAIPPVPAPAPTSVSPALAAGPTSAYAPVLPSDLVALALGNLAVGVWVAAAEVARLRRRPPLARPRPGGRPSGR